MLNQLLVPRTVFLKPKYHSNGANKLNRKWSHIISLKMHTKTRCLNISTAQSDLQSTLALTKTTKTLIITQFCWKKHEHNTVLNNDKLFERENIKL